MALQRIGFPQSAIKSWISCQRLNKRGPTRKMLSRYTNCYGMERQDSSAADDWQAFSSIQTARYLLGKNKRTFSTVAEQDMIRDLIRDHWMELARLRRTSRGMSGCEKLEAFRAACGSCFPQWSCPTAAREWARHRGQFPDKTEGGAHRSVLLRLRNALYAVLRAHSGQGRAAEW